jgi:hypothetical protein
MIEEHVNVFGAYFKGVFGWHIRFIFIFLVVLRVELGLMFARQVPCHSSYSSSPFCVGYF